MDTVLVETYYTWLSHEAFSNPTERRTYEGVLRELHDIPFYWTIVSDDNRVGDAITFRQAEFLQFYEGTEDMDQVLLGQWATAAPSVLEVLLGIARRWNYYFEAPVPFFFEHLFNNLGMSWVPGRVLTGDTREHVRNVMDWWMSRRFEPNGKGSPFPLNHPDHDQRQVDIWGQMNAYSAEHFQ